MINRQTEQILRSLKADGRVEESYEIYQAATEADPKLATFKIERFAEIVAKIGHDSPPLVEISYSDERIRIGLTAAGILELGRAS